MKKLYFDKNIYR